MVLPIAAVFFKCGDTTEHVKNMLILSYKLLESLLCKYYSLKSEPYAYWRRVAESFLINQKTRSLNVTNRNDGANILLFVVCLQPTNNFLCILQHFLLVALPRAR